MITDEQVINPLLRAFKLLKEDSAANDKEAQKLLVEARRLHDIQHMQKYMQRNAQHLNRG